MRKGGRTANLCATTTATVVLTMDHGVAPGRLNRSTSSNMTAATVLYLARSGSRWPPAVTHAFETPIVHFNCLEQCTTAAITTAITIVS